LLQPIHRAGGGCRGHQHVLFRQFGLGAVAIGFVTARLVVRRRFCLHLIGVCRLLRLVAGSGVGLLCIHLRLRIRVQCHPKAKPHCGGKVIAIHGGSMFKRGENSGHPQQVEATAQGSPRKCHRDRCRGFTHIVTDCRPATGLEIRQGRPHLMRQFQIERRVMDRQPVEPDIEGQPVGERGGHVLVLFDGFIERDHRKARRVVSPRRS
jgi:hypothetical protein